MEGIIGMSFTFWNTGRPSSVMLRRIATVFMWQ